MPANRIDVTCLVYPAHRPNLFSGFDIPDFNRIVRSGTDQRAAIGLPGHAHDMVRVPLEGPNMLSGFHVVNLYELIGRPTNDLFAVPRKFNPEHSITVSILDFTDELTFCGRPRS